MPPQNSIELTTKSNGNGTAAGAAAVAAGDGGDMLPPSSTELVVKTRRTDTPPAASVIVPPDGGWGWVVMIASFLCNVIVDGIVFSAGMFLKEIQLEFNVTSAQAAIVSSLLSGFYLMAGPFVSALANRWGFRPVTILGAFIASTGFALSYYTTSIYQLYFTYGVIGGVGFCLIYMPSVITVGYYFERWRAMATGISLCGSGVGTFIFSPLSAYLLSMAGLKGAILIQAGIILLCAVFGLAFRPLVPVQVTIAEPEPEREKFLHNDILQNVIYTKPLPEGRFAYSVPNSVHNTWIGAVSNTQYPTAAEVFRGSGANLDRRPSTHSGGVVTSTNLHHTSKKLEQLSKAQKRMVGTTQPEDMSVPQPLINALQHQELKTVGEDEEDSDQVVAPLISAEDDVKPMVLTARRHTVSGRRPPDTPGSRGSSRRGTINDNITRPLYRDDIFFSGSLVRIPQYQSQTSLGYHMSVTRMPAKHDVAANGDGEDGDDDEEARCSCCPEPMRRTLATMLDMSLLKSPSFMLLALSGFFTMMGFFVPFLYIKERAVMGDMEVQPAELIVSVIGISNTIARIVCGMLTSMPGINALHINNLAISVGGIATIFSGVYITTTYQYGYAVIFGIAIACFSALRSIMVVDLLGLEKLTNAFGILMLFQGLAAMIGAPIAGALMDMTGSYDLSFWLSGSLITLSAILCYPLNIVKAYEERRNAPQRAVDAVNAAAAAANA